MDDNEASDIKQLLRMEVVNKGYATCVAFGLFGCLVYFYSFNCTESVVLIRLCALFCILISFLRFQLIRTSEKINVITEGKWRLLMLYISVNGVLWSIIFTAASLELQFSGIDYVVLTTMLCGFVSTALVTLSGNLFLFWFFQLSLLLPQIILMVHDSLTENQYNLLRLAPIYFVYLIYQLHQVRDFRSKLFEGFKIRSELEKANRELVESQATQMQQTEKLIHTSRLAALGEMAAGIAHEVNNPLAIISGGLQQIGRKMSKRQNDEMSQTVMDLADRSLRGVERISKIINGLRQFSRQSEGLPKTKVCLRKIVDDTLGFCSEMLKARNVRLEVYSCPEIKLECHPVQISQVLINLIKNAEDALSNYKDELDRWIKLSCEEYGDMLLIHVSNGGKKIHEDVQDKLFLPFFTTKEEGKGTGLGLSISRGIMIEHGGDLVFNDSASQTTFTMVLPILGKN